MEHQPSLEEVLGNAPTAPSQGITPATLPPPVATGEQGAPPAPPTQVPAQAADPFEKQRAGLLATIAAERRLRQELERSLGNGGGQRQAAPAQPQAVAPVQPAGDPMPNRNEYGSAEEFQVDYTAWLVNQSVTEAFQRQRVQEQEEQRRDNLRVTQEQRVSQVRSNLDAAVAAGAAKYPDFDEKCEMLRPFLQLAPALHEGLADLGEGAHDVAHYLGSNPAEAARLIQLKGPQAVFRELARISARIEAGMGNVAVTPVATPMLNIPSTLTQVRDARGQFAAASANQQAAWGGPTPLDKILGTGR